MISFYLPTIIGKLCEAFLTVCVLLRSEAGHFHTLSIDAESLALHSDRFFLRISEKIVIFGQNGRILKNHLTNGSC